jgi:hypothetical protein
VNVVIWNFSTTVFLYHGALRGSFWEAAELIFDQCVAARKRLLLSTTAELAMSGFLQQSMRSILRIIVNELVLSWYHRPVATDPRSASTCAVYGVKFSQGQSFN